MHSLKVKKRKEGLNSISRPSSVQYPVFTVHYSHCWAKAQRLLGVSRHTRARSISLMRTFRGCTACDAAPQITQITQAYQTTLSLSLSGSPGCIHRPCSIKDQVDHGDRTHQYCSGSTEMSISHTMQYIDTIHIALCNQISSAAGRLPATGTGTGTGYMYGSTSKPRFSDGLTALSCFFAGCVHASRIA